MGLLEKAGQILAQELTPVHEDLEKALNSFHSENPLFSVILASAPEKMNADEKNCFFDKLTRMVSLMGKAIPLSEQDTSRNLVLIPQSMDRELIAHRIDAALHVDITLAFDAESPGEALEKLKPFL
ncbi:MAG: hypothetical protein LBH43_04575 [Treponema sp.]|jgi:hypothetical protein|nr:hypothetical protein [Treponema sp.]